MTIRSCILEGNLIPGAGPAGARIRGLDTARGCRHGVYLLGNDDPLWEKLATDATLSIYRKKAWKEIVEETFGHQGEYIAAFENGDLVELLPFFLVRGPLGQSKLISTPYQGSNGGFLTADTGVRAEMIEFIKDLAQRMRVQYAEIRSAEPIPELEPAGFVAMKPLIVSVVPLSTPDENWNRLSANHRRNVRSAAKAGVAVESTPEWTDMVTVYHQLAGHYKALGVPFLGQKFFRNVWDKLVMQGMGQLLVARHEGQIIGGHLVLYNGTTLTSKYSVTLHHERHAKLYAAYALYWEAIRIGAEMGLKAFDLGITGEANQGLRDFKGRLGAEERPLYFYYYPLRGSLPDYEKYYSSYKLPRYLWKIAPKPLTDIVGTVINKWIC